jgi:hypothetical protein
LKNLIIRNYYLFSASVLKIKGSLKIDEKNGTSMKKIDEKKDELLKSYKGKTN